jgi:hypothetical protein
LCYSLLHRGNGGIGRGKFVVASRMHTSLLGASPTAMLQHHGLDPITRS